MPTVTNPDPCIDNASVKTCNGVVENGYCNQNEENCYKSCNCDLKMCVDKLDECKELAENTDSCQSEKMQKDCYKSCFPEICSNSFFTTTASTTTTTTTTTTKSTTAPPCEDFVGYCSLVMWNCENDWGKSFCKKSCNHCDLCTDTYTVCADYAKEGRCQWELVSDPDYMVKHCRKSCGFCQ